MIYAKFNYNLFVQLLQRLCSDEFCNDDDDRHWCKKTFSMKNVKTGILDQPPLDFITVLNMGGAEK